SPQWLWGLLYAAPAVVLVSMFVAYPFGSILYHAFTRWDGITLAQWVGLHNFRVLWQDPIFLNALKNNAIFALSVPIQLVLPLVVAYVIHRRVPGWRSFLFSVIVPNLRRVLEIVLVVNTITAFAFMFTYIYTITNGGPGTDTYVSEFYIYQQAFTNMNMGYAAAIGVMLVLIVLAIGLFQIRILTREAR